MSINEGMVVLALRTQDSVLRDQFSRYSCYISDSTLKDLNFLEKVELLRAAASLKRDIELRIAKLNLIGDNQIEYLPGSLFDMIKDDKIQLLLMNGLYEKKQLEELLGTFNATLPSELAGAFNRLFHSISAREYIFLWNMGVIEADDLLQNK
ncbi:hypothetical protein [Paenibacillus sp. WC2504]|uniref:hypothetical protein n=1 Tax=Paenibacillus sp. WC2504 TaxID=3461403 RepID=UPI004046073D